MPKKICIVCGNEASQLCTGCRSVYYCSREHQKLNWKIHQIKCKAYKICGNTALDQYLVPRRDLEPGEIILKEEPFFIAPKQVDGPAICLGCCCLLDGRAVNCPKCTWPMCGKSECWEEGSHHALGECGPLQDAGSRVTDDYSSRVPNGVYQSILILRCLPLSARNPSSWSKMMDLKYCDPIKCLNGVDIAVVVKLVKQWLPQVPLDLVIKVLGIFFLNAFKLPAIDEIQSEGLLGIYSVASLIRHCCLPNATHTFTKDGQIVIRAAVPIAKGTKIYLNFSNPLWGILKRQADLEQLRLGGPCRCQRCSDPSEMDSFITGVYCPICPNQEGILLLHNPPHTCQGWDCNNCGYWKSHDSVSGLFEAVENEWPNLNRESILECETFIQKYSKTIPQNNFFLVDVKMRLCHLYGQSVTGLQDEKLKNSEITAKKTLVLELLKLVDAISPGFNCVRGKVLYHLYSVLEYFAEKARESTNFSESQNQRSLKKMDVQLKEMHAIFKWEPEGTDGGRLFKLVDQKLKHVQSLLQD